ncbi:hypothetical protein CPB86DRAFT_788400, partial [Serendipita vermifera]
MPTLHNDILLAPNRLCYCGYQKDIKRCSLVCKTIVDLNQAVNRLKNSKFKLTIQGCRSCLQVEKFFADVLDATAVSEKCCSLHVLSSVQIAAPFFALLEDLPNLRCIRFGTWSTLEGDLWM